MAHQHCCSRSLPLFHDRYTVPPDIKRDFTDQYNPWSPSLALRRGYSYAAAVLLAIDHFNARDDSVVPELRDLADADCTAHFPDPTFADSRTDGGGSVRALFEALHGR